MKTRVSALMDGELEREAADGLFRDLRADPGLRRQWHDFQRVGEAMRGEAGLDVDVRSRVMAALDTEPTVLAPAARRASRSSRLAWSLAASVAGVLFAGWAAVGLWSDPVLEARAPAGGVAPATLAQAPRVVAPAADPGETERLRDQLLAHHAHAPAPLVAPHHVRTVAAEMRAGR